MLSITVCILSFNRAEYLREAILSVLGQTILPQKILIYDNGSDRSVYECIQHLLDDWVLWIDADVTQPYESNFQRAMNECKTQYVMMLHDDDKLCTSFIEDQMELFIKNPRLVAVSCNGYVINEKSSRNGEALTTFREIENVEMISCSGQVALKYASNSCIPFSPAIYRADVAKQIKLRKEYEKVGDAVFFCDLAEIGPIAYQTKPLYECRRHSGQDSKHFDFDLLSQLEAFFWTRTCTNDDEKSKLHALLLNQNMLRKSRQIANYIQSGYFRKAMNLYRDPSFSICKAIFAIYARIRQKIKQN